jgi:hypothetical protein
MPKVHRDTDSRVCGAKTIVLNQSTVYVNNLLWAVENDRDDHCGAGDLIAEIGTTVEIENKRVIVIGDDAAPDFPGCRVAPFPHTKPRPSQGSDNTFCYGG